MKKSVIIAFFVLIVALILILAIICGKALFAKNLIVNTYQSSNFGINCATICRYFTMNNKWILRNCGKRYVILEI